jgi:hypothetical protein
VLQSICYNDIILEGISINIKKSDDWKSRNSSPTIFLNFNCISREIGSQNVCRHEKAKICRKSLMTSVHKHQHQHLLLQLKLRSKCQDLSLVEQLFEQGTTNQLMDGVRGPQLFHQLSSPHLSCWRKGGLGNSPHFTISNQVPVIISKRFYSCVPGARRNLPALF